MKKTFLMILFAGLTATGFSQFQLGLHGSYTATSSSNAKSLWGGGITGKFLIGGNIALGAGIRLMPEVSEKSVQPGGLTINTAQTLSQYYGSLDIILSNKKDAIQPFLGADLGVSNSALTVVTSGGTGTSINTENKETFFYVAPKAGVNIAVSPAIGLFGQASYALTFGDGENLDNLPNFDSKPVSKFFVFDAGLYFRLSGAKK